jgi:hypothetical protein
VVLREEFELGQGRWRPLELTRLEPDNELIAATDPRLSMFYGLLDGGGTADTDATSGGTDPTSTSESTTGPSTTDSTESTTDATESTTDPSDGTEGSTGADTEETTGGPSVDCNDLPATPLDITHVGLVFPSGGSEDIAMLGDGTFVGRNGTQLLQSTAAGATNVWFAGPVAGGGTVLGLMFADNGDLFLTNAFGGTINRIREGTETVYVDGDFMFSNGLYVDSSRDVWITDFNANAVYRIAASDQEITPIASGGSVAQPNGIFFDEERSIVYWSHYSQSQIWQATIAGNGTPGSPTMTADLPAGSSTDGITMDECGNLYAIGRTEDDAPCRLDRIHLDAAGDLDEAAGGIVELASDGEIGDGCANPVFGYGFGDESDESLWITSITGDVHRVELGVRGYPIALP